MIGAVSYTIDEDQVKLLASDAFKKAKKRTAYLPSTEYLPSTDVTSLYVFYDDKTGKHATEWKKIPYGAEYRKDRLDFINNLK